jgi:hypothetical protein
MEKKVLNMLMIMDKKLLRRIPNNATEKKRRRIQRYNKNIIAGNQDYVNTIQNTLNTAYNSDICGSYNSAGELVHFVFNNIPVETNDLKSGNDGSLSKLGAEKGLPAYKMDCETYAIAPVITEQSTNGALGLFSGNSISVKPGYLEYALPHEVGHSLWLGDSYKFNPKKQNLDRGGVMDNPPGSPNPSEVDEIWNNAYKKR